MPEFTLVAKAVTTATIHAPTARDALGRWRAFQRRNRARKIGRASWLTVDGDTPVVLDQEGKRVQVAEDWGLERSVTQRRTRA